MTGLFEDIIFKNVSSKKFSMKIYTVLFLNLKNIILKAILKYEQEEHLIKSSYNNWVLKYLIKLR